LEDRVRSHRPGRVPHGPWHGLLAAIAIGLAALPSGAQPVQPIAEESTPSGVAEVGGPAASIAVLDFAVQGADTSAEFGSQLARELASILAEDGRVAILDEAVRIAPPAPAPGETRDAALRGLAEQLGADYVVTGRGTQLVRGGGIDLAVRLVPRDVGARGDTQVLTADSEESLLARISEVAEGVLARVIGAPSTRVAAVEILGAPGFEQRLLDRMATRVGGPYDPLVVREDLAILRGSPAIVSAQASTERTDAGVLVRFDVILADPAAERRAEGETITEVVVRGSRRIDVEAIRGRIGSKAGETLDPAQIAADIAEIHKLGFFKDVQAKGERTDAGTVLIFEVEENPLVRQISIAGNEEIDSEDIRDALTLTTGSTLDYPLLFENRQRIEALYRAQGFYLAEVAFEIEELSESVVGIHFDVTEGEKLKLRKIDFFGNERFDDAELADGFQTRRWRFWSYATSWFDNSGTYSEPLFLQDLRGVERKYSDAGYLQVDVGEPDVVADEDGIVVRVAVDEGRLFHVGRIDVTGDSTVDIEALREKLKLKTGDVFNRSYLNDDIAALTEHYQDRGFYFAQVTPLSNLSEATEEVDVDFDVRKGPLYFIRRIEVSGNSTTIDPVVRREIPIAEGQLYSQRKVLLARSRVERLGYFEEVDFEIQPTEEPDQLDLDVSVVERPTGSFSFGAGFSSQDGIVVTGSLSQSNLFGRGYGANVSLDLGRDSQRFFINLADPYFLGTEFSLSTTFSRTELEFEDFEQEQVGVDFVVGHALNEEATARGFLRYSFDLRRLKDDRRINAAALITREILQDDISSSLVGLSVVSDTRDDRLAPTSGHQIGVSLEGAGIGGFSRFARLEGRAVFFLGAPRWLFERSSFVAAIRAGYALPFNRISDFETLDASAADDALLGSSPQFRRLQDIDDDLTLPLTERYFLGGLGQFQLRGFRGRSVGPLRPILRQVGSGNVFTPIGVGDTGECEDSTDSALGFLNGGNLNGVCNDINDRDVDDFDDLEETDVIGGNKFASATFEYRFPISETIGLQGVAFMDMGNAFDERQPNLFDVTEWRYGTGAGVQWFSPFGPLAVVLGFPLDRLSVEDSPVFEFSIGGSAF
jgi:outer membrane protein insertion porin family